MTEYSLKKLFSLKGGVEKSEKYSIASYIDHWIMGEAKLLFNLGVLESNKDKGPQLCTGEN